MKVQFNPRATAFGPVSREEKMSRKFTMGALLALAVSAQACYGPFELTKKLYDWNGSLGDKWVVEGAFLLLNIVPVYDVAVFADAIVLNSVKFWTGKSMLESKVIKQDGIKAVMTGYPDRKVICVDIYRSGELVDSAILMPSEDGSMKAIMRDGTRLVSRQETDGSFVVVSADGKVLGTHARSEVEKYIR